MTLKGSLVLAQIYLKPVSNDRESLSECTKAMMTDKSFEYQRTNFRVFAHLQTNVYSRHFDGCHWSVWTMATMTLCCSESESGDALYIKERRRQRHAIFAGNLNATGPPRNLMTHEVEGWGIGLGGIGMSYTVRKGLKFVDEWSEVKECERNKFRAMTQRLKIRSPSF